MEMTRRGLLTGLVALVAAPAVVRAESLMPVRFVDLYDTRCLIAYQIQSDSFVLRVDRSLTKLKRPKNRPGSTLNLTESQARKLGMDDFAFKLAPPVGTQQYVERALSPQQHELLYTTFRALEMREHSV